jgi:transcriptional regulator with XRE-family HTH domain
MVTRRIGGTLAVMAKSQHARRYRHLPAMLRRLRQEAKLTQRALAAKLDVTHVWVHKSEIGERRVDITEFLDWCIACEVDPGRAFDQLRRQRGA